MAKKWNDIRPLSQKELEELLPNDSDDEIQASHEMQDSDDEVEDNLEKDFSPSESEYEPGTSDVESIDSEQSYTGQRKRRKIVPLSQLQESESPEDNLVVDNGVVEDQNEQLFQRNENDSEHFQELEDEQTRLEDEVNTENQETNLRTGLRGKDGHRWCTVANTRKRISSLNMVHFVQGPLGETRDADTPLAYFWHITDIHLNPHFVTNGDTKKGCSRSNHEGHSRPSKRPVGRYGDYLCDAPWDLIESATKAMVSKQGDNFEFVLWTGDNLSFNSDKREGVQLHVLKNLTDLLMKTFTSQFVFPALGHDDPTLKKEKLGKIWSRWIPTEAMDTLETGGYYMIEIKSNKLRIIVLNTNLMLRSEEDEEANRQWNWLSQILEKIHKNEKVVYIVGHIPPGSDERQRGIINHKTLNYDDYHNKKYLELVRKYSGVIVGQFFGHLHSDSFRVIYNKRGRPVSWAMLAPAVTPRQTPDGSNNPGLRLYRFNKNTGQILDYTQYYLDLPTANLNSKSEPEWVVEYNFSSYYGISNITPLTLHNLADKLTLTNDQSTFTKYFRANSVKMYNSPQGNCDTNCAHTHYCAITRIDYEEYEQCLKTAASALASSSTAASENFRKRGELYIYMLIIVAITTYRVR